MPADEDPGAGTRGEVRGTGGGHLSTKNSSRASSVASVATPYYSSSSSSVSSEIVGLAGLQLRSLESLSSGGSHSPTSCDALVAATEAAHASNLTEIRSGTVPQEITQRTPPSASPSVIQTSVNFQPSHNVEHSITSPSERSCGFPPVTLRSTSPDTTPTVTISRHIPNTASLGWLRSSPTLSSSSSASVSSSPASPPVASACLVTSTCTSVSSSSLVSSLSLSLPPVSLTPYLSHGYSPNTTRILRTSPATVTSSQQPSPASRRASPSLRIPELTSTLDQLLGSGSSRAVWGSGGGEQRGTSRTHNLALTHLSSSDTVPPPCLHSPPPSYDQLCNPNALPTYQEATQSLSGKRRSGDQRTVYTLPSSAEPGTSDPLLQDVERTGLRSGVLASLAAELSDSEGGYSTILDAIPHEHPCDPCATVPIRFLRWYSLRRLRPPKVHPPCLSSVCNKPLVRKELNRRWPFIAGAREDDRCPGLLLVECSSHLTVAHLPEHSSRHTDGGTAGGGGGGGSGQQGSDLSNILGDNFTDVMLGGDPNLLPHPPTAAASTGATSIDLDSALTSSSSSSQVLFYLCGKCVGYDSFDRENVKSHIEYDCPGSYNPWETNEELYLVLRAVLFVVIIIFVFVWLPYLRF